MRRDEFYFHNLCECVEKSFHAAQFLSEVVQEFDRNAASLFARSKDTPRTDLPVSHETGPSTKPWMALPSGCIAGSRSPRVVCAFAEMWGGLFYSVE